MYNVARNVVNTLDWWPNIYLLVKDIPGPEGKPWVGLEGEYLELIWNLTQGESVLGKGKVDKEGRIIAKVPLSRKNLVLRIGVPVNGEKGRKSGVVPEVERPFKWFEQYDVEMGEEIFNSEMEIEEVQALLNQLGYQSGLVDGDWGPMSNLALMNFQLQNKLEIDGFYRENLTKENISMEMDRLRSFFNK